MFSETRDRTNEIQEPAETVRIKRDGLEMTEKWEAALDWTRACQKEDARMKRMKVMDVLNFIPSKYTD